MKNFLTLLILIFLILFSFSFTLEVNATSSFQQGLENTGRQIEGLAQDPPEVIAANVVRALLTLVGIIFVALLIYGGFLYMTSRGEDEKIKKSKKTLIAAVIGIIIIMTGYSITFFVTSTIESPGQVTPAYNEECENPGSPNYYSINCCEYRFRVYGSVSNSCCSQTAFCNAHESRCIQEGGVSSCP
jgi:amino acid transporter